MKTVFILLSLFICSQIALAQTGFTPGYIVKKEGDTVLGLVRSAIVEQYGHQVVFKKDEVLAEQTYFPRDILSFHSDRDDYVSRAFQNTANATGKAVPDTSFAKRLVAGKFNLYTFVRGNTHYYLIVSDTATYFLYNSEFNLSGDLVVPGNYVNVLDLIAIPCSQSLKRNTQLQFMDKEISRYIFALNNCIAPGKAQNYYHKARAKSGVSLFAGGIALGQNSNQFTAQALYRITYPSISKKTSLNIGLNFSYTNASKDAPRGRDYYFYGNYLINTLSRIISVPATIQYNITTGRVQPYVYAGLGGAYLYEHITSDHQIYDPAYTKRFTLSGIFGVGVAVRVVGQLYLQADWRYELLLQHPAIGISYKF